jgi:hypothetical protein
MKTIFVLTALIIFSINSQCQTISGKVIDANTNEPLEYVSIGLVNSPYGCITDKKGDFELRVEGQNVTSQIRISMISYKPQTFTIEKLSGKNNNTIKLNRLPIEIAEVKITPSGKTQKVGTTKFNSRASKCGWNCARKVKSFELGLKLELGSAPVLVKSFHVNVHRQAFDTSKYRLHIRSLSNDLPQDELLTENIIFPITKESGWVEIDLKKYNIVIKGDVALSLEWLESVGRNDDRAMRINDTMDYDYILLKTRKKSGFMYSRWGREGKWNRHNRMTPSMYLTVYE